MKKKANPIKKDKHELKEKKIIDKLEKMHKEKKKKY